MANESKARALEYAEEVRAEFEKRADRTQIQSTVLLIGILIATTLSPILILGGDLVSASSDRFSRLAPALLSGSAAVALSWMQLKKPQERWVLYRTAQAKIQFELDQHRFRNGVYHTHKDPDRLLAERVSIQALELNFEWASLVPRAPDLPGGTPLDHKPNDEPNSATDTPSAEQPPA